MIKKIIILAGLIAAPAAAAAADMVMHRDPGCPCCTKWAAQMERALGREVRIIDNPDRPALMKRLRVPDDLASCHTAIVDGLVLEGHIPAADIKKALARRPEGVVGLAVGGMPLGSPGMEAPGREQSYAVYAFTASGKRTVFARH
jgi:hypothetical protein